MRWQYWFQRNTIKTNEYAGVNGMTLRRSPVSRSHGAVARPVQWKVIVASGSAVTLESKAIRFIDHIIKRNDTRYD